MANLDIIQVTDETAAPNIAPLTTKSLEGTGVFDNLMATVNLHLKEEYNQGRITGQQYSEVYLGAVGAVLQQSVAFLMNHQQEKLIGAQIALTRQKTVTELAQTDDTLLDGLGFNGTTAVEGIVASQLSINEKQELLVDSQIASQTAETDLIGQKLITELGQTDTNLVTAKAAGYGQNVSDVVDGAMAGAKDRSELEARLVAQKLATEVGNTSDIKDASLGEEDNTTIGGLIGKQITLTTNQANKTDKETTLLAQKAITELAQTSDTVVTSTDALTFVTSVTGVVGDQKNLYEAQTEGFARDAEQKVLGSMISAWQVDATKGNTEGNTTNKLNDDAMGTVVSTVALNALGVTL